MEAAPPDKASMDPSVATNVRVEEDEASATENADGEGAGLLYINREKGIKKSRKTKLTKENYYYQRSRQRQV